MGAIDIFGFQINIDISSAFLLMIMIAGLLSAVGVVYYLQFNTMHPKKKFRVVAKSGVFMRVYRLFYGKIVTEMTIFDLLLGKIPHGFHIRNFTIENFEMKKWFILPSVEPVYIGQMISGRLFPFPINVGTKTFTIFKCSNKECEYSDASTFFKSEETGLIYYKRKNEKWVCPKCAAYMEEEPIVIDNAYLHSLKYNPDLESRYIYLYEKGRDNQLTKIPLIEWATIYDVAKEIADEFTQSDREVMSFLDKHNPFVNVLIAIAPLSIFVLIWSVGIYIIYVSHGKDVADSINMGAQMASTNLEIARYLAAMKGVALANVTGG